MHVRTAGRLVLRTVQKREVPYYLTASGLTIRVRYLKRTVIVGGRESNLTGLGRCGLAVRVTTIVAGAKVDVRMKVPHGWTEEEVISRVAQAISRAKTLLKLEKRKMKRRKRSGRAW